MPDDERDLRWKVAAELMAAERHFNSMQNHCRTMASTWLLAAFGGIGFIYAQKLDRSNLLAGVVAIAAAFGIFLLWILDVKVWHRLLLTNYNEGRALEKANDWLPQVRTRLGEYRGVPVRVHISIFYAAGVAALFLIAGFCFRWHLMPASQYDPAEVVFWLLIACAIGLPSLMIYSAWRSHGRSAKTTP
jgi:hypothetical protein